LVDHRRPTMAGASSIARPSTMAGARRAAGAAAGRLWESPHLTMGTSVTVPSL
jgi:hypothetical protein